jgi:hypothetical protein
MTHLKMKIKTAVGLMIAAVTLLLAQSAMAAVPGITGPNFTLTARADYTSQPDGQMIYTWGYSCATDAGSPAPGTNFAPFAGNCPNIQLPGPTLIVHQGDVVNVTLNNELPAAAGNTSIVFTGFPVTTSGGVAGVTTQEAAQGNPVTYTFTATKPGTYAYYSGTRPDLQIEMGLFGVVVVYPDPAWVSANCTLSLPQAIDKPIYSGAAYAHPQACFDREYLFQFSEMMLKVHQDAEAQVKAGATSIDVKTEPYLPSYFLVNGRSMPDDTDIDYSVAYPNQPYNGNPHMHPAERLLMRVVGQGRFQHPFHHHGNHIRVLARDGNLLLTPNGDLAGPLLFTVPTVSGQSVDGIFTWTGQGLNWDVYGSEAIGYQHTCNGKSLSDANPQSPGFDSITGEYCPDHGKPIPVTPANPNIVANGLWYGGSPYLGNPGPGLPPGSDGVNPGAGYAYMWHSHDEREITTNDVFPGGMMMMLVIDAPNTHIDETQ